MTFCRSEKCVLISAPGVAQTFHELRTKPETPSKMMDLDATRADLYCPCGAFKGWKQVRIGGRRLSRSYSDLRRLGHDKGWAWEEKKEGVSGKVDVSKEAAAGQSRLEMLPVEILGK